eukprot:gene15678-17259_t
MGDVSRQEKLASAKRKLKQFQQRKTPNNTPSPRKSNAISIPNVSQNLSFESNQEPAFPKQVQGPPSHQPTFQLSQGPKFENLNGSFQEPLPKNEVENITRSSPKLDGNSDEPNDVNLMINKSDLNEQVIENLNFSPAEKIRQISNKLNGLITNDILRNVDDQASGEIEALEKRNAELEDSLQSYKRSNQQLTNQLNEQRKHLIQYQEKLRKEKSEPSSKQLRELRAAKEQLEVHIQTIGILVSDKTELQENLRKTQKKLQAKENESEDGSNRLHAVRQRIVELERNIANLQMTCDKYQQNNKELAQENEKFKSKVFASSKEKEELLEQISELQEMLAAKAASFKSIEQKNTEINSKLQKAEFVAKQLSAESKESDSLTRLNFEKDELEGKMKMQQELLEKLGAEKGELLQRHHEQIESRDQRLEEQKQTREDLEVQNNTLESELREARNVVSKLEREIAEMKDLEAEEKTSATHLAAHEIDKLNEERQRMENELDIQINENRRVGKLLLAQDDRIQELESALARLGEEAVDRVSLLEDMQSDKETISRAMLQNKELKEQLEELQKDLSKSSMLYIHCKCLEIYVICPDVAVYLELMFAANTNANAELTTEFHKEQHLNQELASKLSSIGVELEEKKAEVRIFKCISPGNVSLPPRLKGIVAFFQRLHSKSTMAASLQDQLSDLQETSETQISANTHENEDLKLTIEELKADLDLQMHLNDKLKHLEAQSELTDKLHFELQSAQAYPFPQDTINLLSSQNTQLRDAMQSRFKEEENALDSYRSAIAQLEQDRDGIYEVLHKEREQYEADMASLRQHMELQLQQQLKQRLRQVREDFQQQIHDEQLKSQSLQTTVDNYKKQDELFQSDVNENGINYETLKIAFQQLQTRFRELQEEKAGLHDSFQELEHTNLQLATETETISEYVNLYRTQRLALKEKFLEKDRLISQLSNEHGRMQLKISQLQELVMQTLAEKSNFEQEKKQLQDLVNKRLEIQSGAERDHEIPKLNLSDSSLYNETIVSLADDERHLDDTESRLQHRNDIVGESDVGNHQTPDRNAQKILQIFEQLHDTGEGYQRGWLSPVTRRHEFTPCKNCSERTFTI